MRKAFPQRTIRPLSRHPAVQEYVRSGIEDLNGRLNRWETIKDFRILDHDMSVEGDELTPTQKLKRKAIESKYRSMLDAMYPELQPG